MIRTLLLAVSAASALDAQTLSAYQIFRTAGRIVIDGKVDEPAWKQAPSVGDFHFNWWTAGEKEQTIAKLLWDDEYLYAREIADEFPSSDFALKNLIEVADSAGVRVRSRACDRR